MMKWSRCQLAISKLIVMGFALPLCQFGCAHGRSDGAGQNAPSPSAPAPNPTSSPGPITKPVTNGSAKPNSQNGGGSAGSKNSNSWRFWVDPYSSAAQDAKNLGSAESSDAHRLQYIAQQAAASWYGNWSGEIGSAVANQMRLAAQEQATAVMVSYNIPNRDCGGYSSGGTNDANAYKSWISNFAGSLGTTPAIVILEPDALAQTQCLDQQRYDLLSFAVTTLKSRPNTWVYLDAGHSAWIDAPTMASRLIKAGVANADGFSLNVSNFQWNKDLIAYANQLRSQGVNKNFVIDTSRNGKGPTADNQWCNPPGRALGQVPTSQTGIDGLDAYLWIKRPGESDGNCNGGPSAGSWWRQMALDLAANAGI